MDFKHFSHKINMGSIFSKTFYRFFAYYTSRTLVANIFSICAAEASTITNILKDLLVPVREGRRARDLSNHWLLTRSLQIGLGLAEAWSQESPCCATTCVAGTQVLRRSCVSSQVVATGTGVEAWSLDWNQTLKDVMLTPQAAIYLLCPPGELF